MAGQDPLFTDNGKNTNGSKNGELQDISTRESIEAFELAEAEPWLVSYADLMTLLFGFFAMLFTYASFEDVDVVKVNSRVAKYFGGSYVAPAEKMADQLKFVWGQSPYKNDLDLKISGEGLEIAFITSVLFNTGSAEILPEAGPPLKLLIHLVQKAEKNSMIRVEGHTDDNPVHSPIFPSNWELSAARAAAIARMFEAAGFPANRLSAAGYGSSRPAFPNRDENGNPIEVNQAHNRRVVVKVVLPEGESKNLKVEPEVVDRPLLQHGN